MWLLLKDSHENQTSSVNLGFAIHQKWLGGGLAHLFMIYFHFTYGGFACMDVHVLDVCSAPRH